VVLTVLAWLAVRNYAALLGVPPGSAAARWLPALYPAVAVIGVGWALAWRPAAAGVSTREDGP
jgi:hypothetical protein